MKYTPRFKLPPMQERRVTEEALAEPVGTIVIGWSFVDQAVDLLIVSLEDAAREHGIDVRRSTTFDDQIKSLRKCFRKLLKLKDIRHHALHELAGAKEVSKIRDCLVHGTFTHSFKEPELAIAFNRLHLPKGNEIARHNNEILTMTVIQQTADSVNDLAGNLMKIAHTICLRL